MEDKTIFKIHCLYYMSRHSVYICITKLISRKVKTSYNLKKVVVDVNNM